MIDQDAARGVVETFQGVVERDGGQLRYVGLAPDDESAVIVEFQSAINDDCDTCTFTADVVHDFLFESLKTNDISVSDVRVMEL